MRDQLVDTLGDLAHSRFLVYLMGPYEAFDVDTVLEAFQTSETPTGGILALQGREHVKRSQ